jgi:hypothetical protein
MNGDGWIAVRMIAGENGPQIADVYGHPAVGARPNGVKYGALRGALKEIEDRCIVEQSTRAVYFVWDAATGECIPVRISIAGVAVSEAES